MEIQTEIDNLNNQLVMAKSRGYDILAEKERLERLMVENNNQILAIIEDIKNLEAQKSVEAKPEKQIAH